MKDRDDIDADVISLIGEPYEIRMAGLLQVEIFLLADIRDVLVEIRDQKKDITVRNVTLHGSPPTRNP